MHNVALIAKREYVEQIRGKAFKITTILVPGIFAFVFFIAFISGRSSGSGKHIVIAAQDAALTESVRKLLLEDKDAKTVVETVTVKEPQDKAALIGRVDAKQVDGFLWIEKNADGLTTATYESQTSADLITSSRLRSALNSALQEGRLAQKGLSDSEIETLLKRIDVDTQQIKNGKEVKSNAISAFYSAYAMAFLLTMTTMIYGLNVGRSVIQEKTSRIFEVMLATVKAGDMLAGKLIGVGAVGLTQIAIWITAALIFASTAFGAQLMAGNFEVHISWIQVVLFAVYFLLGYTLNSALFAGLGATLETEQELQQYSPLAAVPVWLSFSMMVLILSDPNSFWVVAASLFPPCTPIVMFLRMGSQMPPAWQIWLSIAFMLVAISAVLWFSTRLYRIGILMYGKRATVPEILRWLRYS